MNQTVLILVVGVLVVGCGGAASPGSWDGVGGLDGIGGGPILQPSRGGSAPDPDPQGGAGNTATVSDGGRGDVSPTPPPSYVLDAITGYRCGPVVSVILLDGTEEIITTCPSAVECWTFRDGEPVIGDGRGWTCSDGTRECQPVGGPITDVTVLAWCAGGAA